MASPPQTQMRPQPIARPGEMPTQVPMSYNGKPPGVVGGHPMPVPHAHDDEDDEDDVEDDDDDDDDEM